MLAELSPLDSFGGLASNVAFLLLMLYLGWAMFKATKADKSSIEQHRRQMRALDPTNRANRRG